MTMMEKTQAAVARGLFSWRPFGWWMGCFLGLSVKAWSADFDAMHLEGYLERAFDANPQLAAFHERYEAAQQRIPQAEALPDPMFQVTHFVESVQTRTGPQENVFMLSQRLPWFGTLKQRGAAASAGAEALWYAAQNQQLILARTVAFAFYEYAYLGEAIRLTEENRGLLQKLEPVVEAKVGAGGDLNALLRLKVEIGKIDDRLQSLIQQRAVQSAKLRALLAVEGSASFPWPEWEAPGSIVLNASELVASMDAEHPELQMLERQIESAEARQEIARLDRFPGFTLGLNYIQLGDPEVNPTTPDAGKDPWGLTLAVNIPLGLSKYDAAEASARAERRALERVYEDRVNGLRGELAAALSTLEDAQRRLTLYGEELLGLADQAVENSRTSYESGRSGILEVIDSERSRLDLQLLYWRAAADAWQQRVLLQILANQPILGVIPPTKEQ